MKCLIKKDKGKQKPCPHCGTLMEYDVIKNRLNWYWIFYECPNQCKLTYKEECEWIQDDTNSFIYYEEEEIECTTLLP